MTELEKLKKYLDDNGYESKYAHHGDTILGNNKPDQVIVYNHGVRSWDAVCHEWSYGGPHGLLEIYGTICNDVIGWLTADDVIKILEYYAKLGPKWIPINSLDDIKEE